MSNFINRDYLLKILLITKIAKNIIGVISNYCYLLSAYLFIYLYLRLLNFDSKLNDEYL